jgi:hypothetical protein
MRTNEQGKAVGLGPGWTDAKHEDALGGGDAGKRRLKQWQVNVAAGRSRHCLVG